MTTQSVEDFLDDFLFDCWQANKRLTPEDWEWYGKEEHHVEIPARDSGVLTPLNSQDLTQYQHWCAGVMQSEVRGKQCFAFVPKGVLPPFLERLRIKWQSDFSREISNRNREVRSARMMEYNQRMREEGQPQWTDSRRKEAAERMRSRNLMLAESGNHPMQSLEARKRKAEQERERCLQRSAEGTNPFQREGFSAQQNAKRIEEGTHNFLQLRGTKWWVNQKGEVKRQKEKPDGDWQNSRTWKDNNTENK
jgi:hypothetical protein